MPKVNYPYTATLKGACWWSTTQVYFHGAYLFRDRMEGLTEAFGFRCLRRGQGNV